MTSNRDKLKALRNIDFSHLTKEEAKEFILKVSNQSIEMCVICKNI